VAANRDFTIANACLFLTISIVIQRKTMFAARRIAHLGKIYNNIFYLFGSVWIFFGFDGGRNQPLSWSTRAAEYK